VSVVDDGAARVLDRPRHHGVEAVRRVLEAVGALSPGGRAATYSVVSVALDYAGLDGRVRREGRRAPVRQAPQLDVDPLFDEVPAVQDLITIGYGVSLVQRRFQVVLPLSRRWRPRPTG